jgi:glycosidase
VTHGPAFEFHIARQARDRYGFADTLFSLTGNVVLADLAASRVLAHRMNLARDADRHPERAIPAGALNAMGLLDEITHLVLALHRERRDPRAMLDALVWLEARLGRAALDRTLLAFAERFPTVRVYRGLESAADWLAGATAGVPHRAVALEELITVWLANANPATRPFAELFDDTPLAGATAYRPLTRALGDYFATRPRFGPADQSLVDMLRAPALASPDSLEGQLEYVRHHWADLLGDFLRRLLIAMDVLREEAVAIWLRFHPPGEHARRPGGGLQATATVPSYASADAEAERFSPDEDWMASTVLIAKSTYVWLDQLSKAYGRAVYRLDHVPDEELDTLARRGFNALWLIGVWERSRASERIKRLTGNPEAVASAYSLHDYVIAGDLGGAAAYENLRDRARARGIRLASDMVPNHMGIDSRWMIEHPDWFLALPEPPYPSYRFDGPNVSSDDRVEIKIEDHYYDRTDAAVVFRRVDRRTGDTRFVYHGNDGTSFPWNDTAQLDFLRSEVREGVIQTILHVARQFPIIRFDAAMTLAKRHFQRLWFPEPGSGGAIPSRAERGLTKAEFDARMPVEFWREVVDRVAAEAPGTLLLAEAFWLMEGYFVRTLGMHRVYNSAFMVMLRDEDNAKYRLVIKNTLEFDPEILKRYVNFMNNPDERTAVDQFGTGDKAFGVATMMATLPGLPMFGHGQVEGFTERYGMEYRRAYHDERPDPGLVARHERQIAPLLHRRVLFAEARDFRLYDCYADEGWVQEDVFAYSNRRGAERALVVYHNRYADAAGWLRMSCAFAEKTGDGGGQRLVQQSLGDALGLSRDDDALVAFRDVVTGLEYLHRSRALAEQGLRVSLHAYECRVLLDWRELRGDAWMALADHLGGRGVPSLAEARRLLELAPVHAAWRAVLAPPVVEALASASASPASSSSPPGPSDVRERVRALLVEALRFSGRPSDAARRTPGASGRGGDDVRGSGHRTATGADPGGGDPVEGALRAFDRRWRAASRLLDVERRFRAPWPDEVRAVLPARRASPDAARPAWGTIVAWCALEALGRAFDPSDPSGAAVRLFDDLRLRAPLADALGEVGLAGEDRWRGAARVRLALAHPADEPATPGPARSRGAGSFDWLRDPDAAWLAGAHEHEGTGYIVKEAFESLLWWRALPALLAAAEALDEEGPPADGDRSSVIERQIAADARVAADAGYRIPLA